MCYLCTRKRELYNANIVYYGISKRPLLEIAEQLSVR